MKRLITIILLVMLGAYSYAAPTVTLSVSPDDGSGTTPFTATIVYAATDLVSDVTSIGFYFEHPALDHENIIGATSVSGSTDYVYATQGTYTLVIEATNELGEVGSATATITVTDPTATPTETPTSTPTVTPTPTLTPTSLAISMVVDATSGTVPFSAGITLTATDTVANVSELGWYFKHPELDHKGLYSATAVTEATTYIYDTSSVYTLVVEATNSMGDVIGATETITVLDPTSTPTNTPTVTPTPTNTPSPTNTPTPTKTPTKTPTPTFTNTPTPYRDYLESISGLQIYPEVIIAGTGSVSSSTDAVGAGTYIVTETDMIVATFKGESGNMETLATNALVYVKIIRDTTASDSAISFVPWFNYANRDRQAEPGSTGIIAYPDFAQTMRIPSTDALAGVGAQTITALFPLYTGGMPVAVLGSYASNLDDATLTISIRGTPEGDRR